MVGHCRVVLHLQAMHFITAVTLRTFDALSPLLQTAYCAVPDTASGPQLRPSESASAPRRAFVVLRTPTYPGKKISQGPAKFIMYMAHLSLPGYLCGHYTISEICRLGELTVVLEPSHKVLPLRCWKHCYIDGHLVTLIRHGHLAQCNPHNRT